MSFTLKELLFGDFDFESPNHLKFSTPRGNFSSFVMSVEGARDPSLWRFISSWVSRGDVFVDVGANIGTYTVPASGLVGGDGLVVAFEAHPRTYAFLIRSVGANRLSNVQAVNQAVSDQDGTVRIAYNANNPGETHISRSAEEDSIDVAATTLDSALSTLSPDRIRYIKIDVEGFEICVLRGAVNTLSRCARLAVQTEIDQKHIGTSEQAIEAFFSLLAPLGYEPYRIDSAGHIAPAERRIIGDVVWMRPSTVEEIQQRRGS